ncbi:Cys-Gln thioester bond-forming surface protein [Glycomyces sp. NRRL B-16210]|uniref:Cys-Gln thioester bond-forming surface protein n=1 Tax=Glycomyces sp. NRRL B-16210 TaxID=1463821 RepID=UPI0004C140FA|nr:Cys-Gln thioester bond-forming surface protein [Glycomyces sp. NRRL B-16210]
MMTKALKGSLAAAAGLALALSGAAVGHAQDDDGGAHTSASGSVSTSTGIQLRGHVGTTARSPHASLISLDLGDGESRTVYCIQFNVPLQDAYTHEERAWEDVPVEQLPLVLGVLVNGFNGSNAAELLTAAEADGEDLESYTAEQVAYAGTQSAIWSLTDGWTLNPNTGEGSTFGGPGVDNAVTAIQDYLLAESEPIDEPDFAPYFEVDESEAAVEGTKVGPYTVQTNLDELSFTQPDNATVVDENGVELTSFTDGQTFYVILDEEATTSVTLETDTYTWTTPAGRTFVPVTDSGENVEGQRLILAEEYPSTYTPDFDLEITIEEVPSESPKPQLPVTGASLTMVASVGGAVLLAGVGAMVLMRRRAARADWGSDA